MWSGSLFNQKASRTRTSAVSWAEGSLGKEINWANFEKQTTTVKMMVLPLEASRLVVKSINKCDLGCVGMGSGLKRIERGWLEVLFWVQGIQAEANSWVSSSIMGHQNHLLSRARVCVTAGWHANLEECAH